MAEKTSKYLKNYKKKRLFFMIFTIVVRQKKQKFLHKQWITFITFLCSQIVSSRKKNTHTLIFYTYITALSNRKK